MHSDRPDRLDTLIDEVARAATSAAPSGHIQARVRQRIAAPGASSAVTWPRVAVATAAAAVAVALLWPPDRREAAPAARQSSSAAAPGADVPAGPTRERDTVMATGAEPSTPRRAARRSVPRQVTAPVRAEDAMAIAPLDIEPMLREDLDVAAASVLEHVEIDPISVHPLAVGPLASDEMQ